MPILSGPTSFNQPQRDKDGNLLPSPEQIQQLRLRRQEGFGGFGPIGPPTTPFGGSAGTVNGLVNSVEAFGPITPVGLFPQFQSGGDPSGRGGAPGQPQPPGEAPGGGGGGVPIIPPGGGGSAQSFTQPTVGGPATALALARLSPSRSLTNPLRANIRQS